MPAAAVRFRIRHVLKGLAVGAGVAALLLLLRDTYAMRALELKTLDARFRALHDPSRADTNIVIVDVDNASLEALRPLFGRWPWRRESWATVVRFAAIGHARAVVFDFLLPDPDLDHPASDSAFALAASAAGTVVQSVTLQQLVDSTGRAATAGAPLLDSSTLARIERAAWPMDGARPGRDYQIIEHPYEPLLGSSRALGVINFTPDPVDGALRRIPLLFGFRGRAYPTLGLAAAAVTDTTRFRGRARFEGRTLMLGGVRVPVDTGTLLVNWRGPYKVTGRSETYRIYPAAQIVHSYQALATGGQSEVPAEALRGKIVFVGASGSGLFEARANPFGSSDPGVLIHATVADNLLTGDFLRPASPAGNVAATLLAALLAGLVVSLFASAWWSGIAAAALLALDIGVAAALFARGHVWVDMAAPSMALVLTFTGGMALNYVTEGRRKRQIRDMFSKYVAPEYVAQLAEDPASLDLAGRRAELSILFSDIRGFTSISEKLEPHQVIEFLNEYLTQMAAIVKDSGGTLDKFIGDAVMAFWGEPVRHADHADRAADCALAMRDATARLAARWVAEGKPDLRIGIGISTAEVVVGNIGSLEHKLDYTVIGDGVNLASRLEGLNKEFKTTIIISEFARVKLGDRFDTRALGDVKVKGKEQPVPIYELLGRRAPGAGAPA
ncbi:MAG: CHASE2 domain-containing protein [Gemmatimonadales bacterium]